MIRELCDEVCRLIDIHLPHFPECRREALKSLVQELDEGCIFYLVQGLCDYYDKSLATGERSEGQARANCPSAMMHDCIIVPFIQKLGATRGMENSRALAGAQLLLGQIPEEDHIGLGSSEEEILLNLLSANPLLIYISKRVLSLIGNSNTMRKFSGLTQADFYFFVSKCTANRISVSSCFTSPLTSPSSPFR